MRNRILLTLLILAFSSLVSTPNLSAQPKWNSVYQNYIDQYKDLAIEQMLRYNIPASITLAQGLLESGAGRSQLTRSGNNHFGKADELIMTTTQRANASALTTTPSRATRTTASFSARSSATRVCSPFRVQIIKVGLRDSSIVDMPLIRIMPHSSFR